MAIGRTNAGGGGAALNFEVVPGLAQPGTASENTIWVKTERTGAWYFSATQPEGMQEWDVWFQTGAESNVEFNALKKNSLQVYMLDVRQMVAGDLVYVHTEIYQNDEWIEIIPAGALYWDGKKCEDVTGGWQFGSGRTTTTSVGSYVDNGDSIKLSTGSGQSMQMCTKQKVSFSGYSKLKIQTSNATEYSWFKYGDTVAMSNGIARANAWESETVEIDISTQNGSFYVAIEAYAGGNAIVQKIWRE